MNSRHLLFIAITLFIPSLSNGQGRTITGKVVYESDFNVMAEVKIQNRDKVVLGTTDMNGVFKIEIPAGTDELLLSYISMEPTTIKLPANCSNLEILMMVDVIYDYISVNRINKKRHKLFRKLPNRHRQAFEQGIFTSDTPCFTYVFQKY